MMHANGYLVLVAATLFGLGALGEGAQAGRCKLGRSCGGLAAGHGAAYLDVQAAPVFGRKGRRARLLLGVFPQVAGGDAMIADNEFSEGNLIPESMAVTQALAAYPEAKPLGVKLLPGSSPVYAVKLRVDGQILRILIDAQSAQILGQ
jgi:hypothetical protein